MGQQLFSQRVGYAIHALAYMARRPYGAVVTLPEVADWLESVWPSVSVAYLSNVLQRLTRRGLLRSVRGMAGGYALGRDPAQLSLCDVVAALDGIPDVGTRCGLSLEDRCPSQRRCSIQRRLVTIERQFVESLRSITIADLAREIKTPMTQS